MNQRRFRLVFDRRRGMRVPVAEGSRSLCKPASASAAASAALAVGTLGLALSAPTLAAGPIPRAASLAPRVALPVRSADPARTAGDFGSFSLATPTASRLVVNQSSAKAIINWDSFDVANGSTVQFVQPDKGSALNRIWDANPSVVLGRIEANGEVILQNTNGLIFGPTARVETGRFVATALQVAEEAFKRGIRGATDGSASFANADEQRSGFVSIERGAEIRSAAGGDVLVFAPRVVNEGRIETPGGQTVLGAGQTVYLSASADPTQRGLIVGIQPYSGDSDLNTVTQAAALGYKTVDGLTVADSTPDATAGLISKVNAIVAERGAINLVGLMIHQNGLLQATTAVKGENGVIQLLSQSAVNPLALQSVNGQAVNVPQTLGLGTVILGPTSLTQVLPAADKTSTQLDAETFNPSHIRVEGQQVLIQGGAQVLAPSGKIEVLASNRPDQSIAFDPGSFNVSNHATDASRIVIESGATLSVAGLRDVELPMSRNQLSGRLFQIELADSPVQRDGPLYREEIFFDARSAPTIANVSGFYSTVGRTAEERSIRGGTISVQSDGALAVDSQARIDVSGGSVRYGDGEIRTSLLRQGNSWVAIDKASAGVAYDELGNAKVRTDAGNALFRTDTVLGYVQGSDAGSATLAGRRMYFAGTVDGGVVTGVRQTGRGPDAPPVGGELVLGRVRQTDSSLTAITLTAAAPENRPAALFSDPLAASVDDNVSATLQVSAAALGDQGIAVLKAYALSKVVLQQGAALALGNRGQFTAEAGEIRLDGTVRMPAGRVELTTLGDASAPHDLVLGAQSALDVSGTWIDDSRLANAGAEGANPVALDGGSVTLVSASSLRAASGARIDVSAGARRATGSSLSTGKAGAITLTLNNGADVSKALPGTFDGWQATLAGYDFDRGASLSISGLPSLKLGGNGLSDSRFNSAWFSGHGFGQIALSSLGDVEIGNTFRLDLQLANYLPDLAAGSTLAEGRLATVGVKPVDSQRAAVSLSLQATTAPNLATGVRGASLLMQAGSHIGTEAGGSLRLGARRSLTLGGELVAPGGTIDLALRGSRGGAVVAGVFDDTLGFLADQAIWLTPQARLSVAGTTELTTDRLGRSSGTVYGGGTLSLNAERGYVVAEAGAELDLRGAAATVLTAVAPVPLNVSKAGGTLNIATPEGLHFDATVLAAAADAAADGGNLSVAISLGGKDRLSAGVAFPITPRVLRLSDGDGAVTVGQAGDSVSAWLGNGSGTLSNARLQQAGFSSIKLKADDSISLDANLTLAATRAITLDARTLAGAAGVEASVVAPYVALGDQRLSARASFETLPASSTGSAVLDVRGALIEVFGNTALQGYQFAALNATLDPAGGNTRRDGEVRLVGTARGQAAVPIGSLDFSGELQVTAGQLYATTLSDFSLAGRGAASYFGSYQPLGGANSAVPLSALASLSISASRVDIGGVVRQPFGELSITADQLKLLSGSEVSVSGADQAVPVGTTVNGRQWQYRADGLFQTDGTAKSLDAANNPDILSLAALPVDKGLSLNGKQLSIASDARISAAGGGSLKAWEFVAGVGGSTDTLARAGYYAVLPTQTYEFAASDAEVLASAGTAAPRPGAQIDITMAGSALAPGRYTLLPARYALLPGAVLVSVTGIAAKSALLAAQLNDDGSAVVTGAMTGIGSKAAEPQRILVEPAATVLARSRLDVTDVAALLTGVAARLDLPTPVLPGDAGRVTLQSQQAFNMAASVGLQGVGGAAGGQLDIAVDDGKLAIVDDVAAPPSGISSGDGWSLLSAAALGSGGAGSVLLGGLRSADGSAVDTRSQQVALLATQHALTAGEVMLTGRDGVNLATGSSVVASGAADPAARTLALSGDSAFLLVSSAVDTRVSRSYAAGATQGQTGVMTVDGGVELSGPSVQINAASRIAFSNDSAVSTQHLGLSTQRIAVGAASGTSPAAANTTVIDGKLLAAVAVTPWVELGSLSSIDFNGSRDLRFDTLTLDAPLLRGLGDASTLVHLEAGQLNLRNSTGQNGDPSPIGQGRLELQASGSLRVGGPAAPGAALVSQALAFDTSLLASAGDLIFAGSGRVVAQGDATLRAMRVTAQSGTNQGVNAPAGLLRVEPAGAGSASTERVGQGAELHFAGQRIEQMGRIEAPGGLIELAATGVPGAVSVNLGADSLTSAAGFSVAASPTWTAYGDAGRVQVSAGSGSVRVAGRIDVSAAGDARSGSVSLSAPGSASDLDAGVDFAAGAQAIGGSGPASATAGGSLRVDGGRIRVADGTAGDLDALATLLAGSGFDKALDLRQRRGDLSLVSGTLRAEQLSLSADAGNVRVDGEIDARAPAGGTVRITAGNDLALGGRIRAGSSRAGANGGDVLLSARDGELALGGSARIDASGDDAQDGRLVLRAGRDDLAGTVRLRLTPGFDSLQQVQAGELAIEAVRTYEGATRLVAGASSGTALGQDSLLADGQTFAANSGQILSTLGLAADARAALRNGVEVRATGDFTVADDFNLASAGTPEGQLGFLTLRAAGHLKVTGSLSDGFVSASRPDGAALTEATALLPGAAASYRLVAGADLAAADPMATRAGATADLTVSQNKLVRTTAGSIELAAARDVVLAATSANATQGVVYVAGRPQEGADLVLQDSAWTPQFTDHGGQLRVTAGRDVIGSPATQLFGAWLYHTGAADTTPVAWWSAFDAFRQGLGSFGGGSVQVSAGRDVVQLGVVAPSSGLAPSAIASDGSPAVVPKVSNGGDIDVQAGRNILGGTYLLGRGQGLLQAGGQIGEAAAGAAGRVSAIAPVLGLMDGSWALRAVGDVRWAAIFNPTMLPSANLPTAGRQRISDQDAGVFFTYGAESSLSVASQAGTVAWQAERPAGQASMSAYWSGLAANGPAAERIEWNSQFQDPTAWAPPVLEAKAFGGPLTVTLPSVSAGLTLYPSPAGRLSLYASGDLSLISNQNTVALALSDQLPGSLPSVVAPLAPAIGSDSFSATTFDASSRPDTTVWAGIARNADEPVRLAAGGNLDLSQGSRAARVVIVSPKAAEISAGGDIRNLSYIGQQSGTEDVTSISAGGSLVQGVGASANRITLAGPGELKLSAGRQLDLGSSEGVETVGNQYAPGLPSQGAAITLAAGLRGTLDVAGFTGRYLTAKVDAATPDQQAATLADSYWRALGKDPAALSADDQAASGVLVQRYAAYLRLQGADAAGVQQRRDDWVALVRQSLGLPVLSGVELAAAYDGAAAAFKGMSGPAQVRIAEQLLTGLFAQAYLAEGQPYAALWQTAATAAGVPASQFSGSAFERVRRQVLFAEFAVVGDWVSAVPASAANTRQQIYALGFSAADLSGLGSSQRFAGDLDIVASGVQARNGGDITLLAPGGQINVGLPGTAGGSARSLHGVVSYGAGNISALADGDFQVNSQRVFVVGQGNIGVWSSNGNIDAGRGANTSITIPALVPTRQADGSIAFTLPSISVGSGIGILQPATGQASGNIGLYAPNGEVRALDAQIRAPGRITLAADVVRGADNIAGGSVVGAPPPAPVVVSALASQSGNAGESQAALATANAAAAANSAAVERSSLLLVELLGLGSAAADNVQDDCPPGSARPGGPGSTAACKPGVGAGSQ